MQRYTFFSRYANERLFFHKIPLFLAYFRHPWRKKKKRSKRKIIKKARPPPSSLVFVSRCSRLQTPRARPIQDKCGCIPCGVPVLSIDSGLYPEQDYVPDKELQLRLISCCYLRCCFWLCLLVRILSASRLAQRSGTAGKPRKKYKYICIYHFFCVILQRKIKTNTCYAGN